MLGVDSRGIHLSHKPHPQTMRLTWPFSQLLLRCEGARKLLQRPWLDEENREEHP